MPSRFVWARATRTALIVASVPLDTKRRRSRCGSRSRISSPRRSSSSVGIPKLVPAAIASSSASITAGGAWPNTSGPHDSTKSMYSLPSTSKSRLPTPRSATTGVPPTPPKARTGEFTPPGNTSRDRRMISEDLVFRVIVRSSPSTRPPPSAADGAGSPAGARTPRP